MKAFGEDYHNDFLYMFQKVKKESVSEDMKAFWEAQEKAKITQSDTGGTQSKF